MPEKEFEELVRRALLKAGRAEWERGTDEAEEKEPGFSPRYRRRRLRLMNDPFSYAKKRTRPMWKKALQTAASILLVGALSLGTLMSVSPDVRAWVEQVVLQRLDTHNNFYFGTPPEAGKETGDWRPAWLPEGVRLVKEVPLGRVKQLIYEEADGTRLYLDVYPAETGTALGMDNEHQDYSEITINGHSAYLMTANEEGYMSFLVWVDEENDLVFRITSELSAAEMIKMAESVARVD